MQNLIDIQDIHLSYETASGKLPVLDGFSMSVAKDGFAAVVGPSGCGKSTLTRLVAGLLKPDSGTVWLDGEKVTTPRASVGMAFQNPVLLEWRSIIKNIMLPLEIVPTKLSKAEQHDRARYLLSLVGLEGFEDKRPSELSGGMRGIMITHDLRESIYLADQVVVMSGRPAKTQYVLDLPVKGPRSIETLYTPQAASMLKVLRHQIEIAQGRTSAKTQAVN